MTSLHNFDANQVVPHFTSVLLIGAKSSTASAVPGPIFSLYV